jgi:hypothetical protein
MPCTVWHTNLRRVAHSVSTAMLAGVLATPPLLAQISQPKKSDTWTPDHDGNGFNNSFERAINIGQLTPKGAIIHEQLGAVLWGFDTNDFYKFIFPSGVSDLHLSIRLDEEPNTTISINMYDRSRKLVNQSTGNTNELFRIPLTQGEYYLEVITDKDTANGRNLLYTLNANAVEIPLPDKSWSTCRGAPSLGALSESGKDIEGNFNTNKRSAFYNFYIPYSSVLSE